MRLRNDLSFLILLLLGAFLLSSLGCGPFDPFEVAEDTIEDYLVNNIGPADRYDVRISRGEGTRLSRGYLGRVWIKGRKVKVIGGLTLKSATAELQGVQVDLRKKRLKDLKNSRIQVEVTDQELTRYLKQARPHLQDLHLSFSPDGVQLTARPVVLFNLAIPVMIEGDLLVSSSETISFEPNRAKVAVISVPSSIIQWIARQINPLFDTRELRFPVILEKVSLQPGLLVVEGRVDASQLP